MQAVDQKTDLIQIEKAFQTLKANSLILRKEPLTNRIDRLKKLRAWIHTNRPEIHKAAYNDFRKAASEVDGIEIFHVLNEIKLAVSNLETWAQPKKVDATMSTLGTRSYIQYEPRGLCLIISPWNYPFSLAVGPLVSAIAAGNAVIIKPSELTPNVSALLFKMVSEVFDSKVVSVFEGGPDVAQFLLKLPFDHIFFTGSPSIGKHVMRAAAENLTSVTLELGGKSPTVITASANISDAAKRTAVAKFVNNGQTCVAPDYILVDETISAKYLSALIEQTKKLFLGDNKSFEESESYCRIVNDRHFKRLNELLQDALNRGAKLEFGGNVDEKSRFIHPMIMSQVSSDSRMLEEEIFGPILPIVVYKSLDDVVSIINSKPKALALYIFTTSSSDQKKVLTETSAGGVCVNDCGIHFLHHNLPFGGVNNSGMGKSHGHFGFLAFSNEKPVMKQKSGWTPIQAFYPPYTSRSAKIMDWFLKLF